LLLVREVLKKGRDDLESAGIKLPGLDASILLAFVLNTNRTLLLTGKLEFLSEEEHAAYCELIKRRCNGECVAAIIGKKEFMGLEFTVNNSVLVPRPDTEILVEAALEILKNTEAANVLDLCTGSGAVAISLKSEIPNLEVYATDISNDALDIAKKNADRLLPKTCNINFLQGDLYDALQSSAASFFRTVKPQTEGLTVSGSTSPFSLIVSNPPYIPTNEINTLSAEVQKEPRIALDGGESGLDIIKRIIKGAPGYLQQGGVLLMEADPRQMSEIKGLLEIDGFKDIMIFKDLSGSERVIKGKYDK
jgi:release factor glutamine methyltransferase